MRLHVEMLRDILQNRTLIPDLRMLSLVSTPTYGFHLV